MVELHKAPVTLGARSTMKSTSYIGSEDWEETVVFVVIHIWVCLQQFSILLSLLSCLQKVVDVHHKDLVK